MDDFKISYFETGNPGSKFPHFRILTSTEAANLRKRFFSAIDQNDDTPCHVILTRLFDLAELVGNLSEAKLTTSNFVQLVQADENILLDWGCFDNIDEMKLSNFLTEFDAIWYGSEDLTVFDYSCSWMMFIMHYGDVKLLKLQ